MAKGVPPANKREREVYGEYEVLKHPGGGFSVWGPGINKKRGFYVTSDEKLIQQYEREVAARGAGGISRGLSANISYRGLLEGNVKNYSAGKRALGLSVVDLKDITVSEQEIKNAIISFWPQDQVEKYMDPKNNGKGHRDFNLGSITDFSKKYQREFHSAHRAKTHRKNISADKTSMNGFERMVEEVYPGFYKRIHFSRNRKKELNRDDLRKRILERFYSGLLINKSYLYHSSDSNERDLAYQIIMLANQDGHGNYTQTVMGITGLKRNDVEVSPKAKKDISKLSERLTGVLFSWAPLVGVNLEDLVSGDGELIMGGINRQEDLKFSYEDEDGQEFSGIADLRVGNTALEVKNGFSVPSADLINNLVQRYSAGINKWVDGEKMEETLLVLNQKEGTYSTYSGQLAEAGIKVLEFSDFHRRLRNTVNGITTNFSREIMQVRPRIHDLDYLLKLHEEISLRPATLVRGEHYENINGRNAKERRVFSLIKDLDENSTTKKMLANLSMNKQELYGILSKLSDSGLVIPTSERGVTYWKVVNQPSNIITRLKWSDDLLRSLIDLSIRIKHGREAIDEE